MDELTFKNGTYIEWIRGDDGGGSVQYIDFLNVIPPNSKFEKCLEWCAGLSAISFSLLDAGIIDELILMDKYEPALVRAENNAKNNGFKNVRYYHCDKISDIPVTEKFDLVVGNPPHCYNDDGIKWGIYNGQMLPEELELNTRLILDQDWKIHKEFFTNIVRYLNDGAELYISENGLHSELLQYIKDAGLTLVKIYEADMLNKSASNKESVIMHMKYETKIY